MVAVFQNNAHHAEGIADVKSVKAAFAQNVHHGAGKRRGVLGVDIREKRVADHHTVDHVLLGQLTVRVQPLGKQVLTGIVGKALAHMAVIGLALHRRGVMLGHRQRTALVHTACDLAAEARYDLLVGADDARCAAAGAVFGAAVKHGVTDAVVAEARVVGRGQTAEGTRILIPRVGRRKRNRRGDLVARCAVFGIAQDKDRVIGRLVHTAHHVVAVLHMRGDPYRAKPMLTDHGKGILNVLFSLIEIRAKQKTELLLLRQLCAVKLLTVLNCHIPIPRFYRYMFLL